MTVVASRMPIARLAAVARARRIHVARAGLAALRARRQAPIASCVVELHGVAAARVAGLLAPAERVEVRVVALSWGDGLDRGAARVWLGR